MKKIYSIFSKTPVQKNRISITLDHREKNSLIPAFLTESGFALDWQQLPVADYIIKNIAIERKTIQDLKASIINKRLAQQLIELKQYPNHLLLIEGILNESLYTSGIHENALRGFLLAVALEFRTPIIFTYDERDTAKYLAVLAKKERSPEVSIRATKIAHTKEEQKQFILEGFPHIGPAKAKALIKQFSALQNIFNASESDLEPILNKKAKEFKEILR
jgi:DNA excision repair protein ERCC-4